MNFKTYEHQIFLVEDNETQLRRANDLSKVAVYSASDPLPPGKNVGDIKTIPKRTQVNVTDVKADAARTAFAFVNPVDTSTNLPSGWTKASNLLGGLVNEIVSLAPAEWVVPPQENNFTVTDAKAVLRSGAPDFKSTGKIITKGTFVIVTSEDGNFVKVNQGTFVNGQLETGDEIGWTAAANLTDGWSDIFATAQWDDTKGPNSCWEKGNFIGNRVLANIVGMGSEMEQVTLTGLAAYLKLKDAAAKKNLALQINSGFRTYQRQAELFAAYKAGKGNLAAQPGKSNHQHGQAFDLNTHGFDGDPIYDWLKKNAPKFGFIRTVNKEHWHWEYRPSDAAELNAKGEFKLPSLKV